MKSLLIVQPDGVLCTREDITHDRFITTDRVNILAKVIDDTKAGLCIYHNSQRKDEKIFWSRMLKLMGIRYGLYHYFASDTDFVHFLKTKKPRKFCILSSTMMLSGLKNVVLTNADYGLQWSDAQRVQEILR